VVDIYKVSAEIRSVLREYAGDTVPAKSHFSWSVVA